MSTSVRVSIKYNSKTFLIVFEADMGEKEMIEASLDLFGLDQENHQIYDLLSRKPLARVLNSKFMRENDYYV